MIMRGYNMLSDKIMTIYIKSHHYQITNMSPYARTLIDLFSNKFLTFKFDMGKSKFSKKKHKLKPDKYFAAFNAAKTEFRFHINTLKDLILFLSDRRIRKDRLDIIRIPIETNNVIDLELNEKYKPYDYQQPHIDHLSNINDNVISKLLSAQTGKGKTLMAIHSLMNINYVTGIVIPPKYINKWIDDIKEYVNVRDTDIITVQGSGQLRGLIDSAKNNNMIGKFIIFSNRTLMNFIKGYEENNGDMSINDYGITPDELFQLLGISIILVDEVHLDFHSTFKLMLYSNIHLLIGLSATLVSANKYLTQYYNMLFPISDRCKTNKYDKYVDTVAVEYKILYNKRVKTSNFYGGPYSHNAFEKSIMELPNYFRDYVEMIKYLVDSTYIQYRKPGDKLAVFASTVEMCTFLNNHLKWTYPNLTVERYVEEDPYENIIEPDIRVTTILSGGTAIDIPNLTTVIQTINILSQQSNLQTIGRLRKLKNRQTKFYYLWCSDIPKHKEYNYERQELLKDKIRTFSNIRYQKKIGIDVKH